MNKKIKIAIVMLVLLTIFSVSLPLFNTYKNYYSESSYRSAYINADFDDLFFEPKSKKCEIYSIGGFGYIDLTILEEHPDEIEYYKEYSYRVFEGETIDKLMELLRECTFIPVERTKAFLIHLRLSKKNAVTSLNLSSSWFDDRNNSLFSEKLANEINEQISGISECTIFEHNNKLYLTGFCPTRITGGSYMKYEKPDFSNTLTVMYEIEESEAAKELLDSKDMFYPGENRVWKP